METLDGSEADNAEALRLTLPYKDNETLNRFISNVKKTALE